MICCSYYGNRYYKLRLKINSLSLSLKFLFLSSLPWSNCQGSFRCESWRKVSMFSESSVINHSPWGSRLSLLLLRPTLKPGFKAQAASLLIGCVQQRPQSRTSKSRRHLEPPTARHAGGICVRVKQTAAGTLEQLSSKGHKQTGSGTQHCLYKRCSYYKKLRDYKIPRSITNGTPQRAVNFNRKNAVHKKAQLALMQAEGKKTR